jgi:hypothetical protein
MPGSRCVPFHQQLRALDRKAMQLADVCAYQPRVRTNQDLDAIIAIHGITSEVHPPHRLRGMCARNTRGSSRLLTYTLFTSSSNPQPEFIRRRREGFPFAQLGSRELEISRNVPDENLSTE